MTKALLTTFIIASFLTSSVLAQQVTFKVPFGAGFAAKAMLIYEVNGQTRMQSTGTITAGRQVVLTVPGGGRNARYRATCIKCNLSNPFSPKDAPFKSRSSGPLGPGGRYTVSMTGTFINNSVFVVHEDDRPPSRDYVPTGGTTRAASNPPVNPYANVRVYTCLGKNANGYPVNATSRATVGTLIQLSAIFQVRIPADAQLMVNLAKGPSSQAMRSWYSAGVPFNPANNFATLPFTFREAGLYRLTYFSKNRSLGYTYITVSNASTTTQTVANTAPAYRVDPSIRTTALQQAVLKNDYNQAMKMVVEQRVNVNARDSSTGRTAIHYAALADDEEMIQMLKDKGNADINARDNQGKTALDLALEGSHFDAAKALLKNNADARLATSGLDRVVATNNKEILRLMLQNGADPNVAINKAIAQDNDESMNFVFQNSNARANNQLFDQAINQRSTKCAAALLQNGIDKSKAMDYVIQKKDKTMVDMVLGTGVDVTTANKALLFYVEQRDVTNAQSVITNNNANASVGMPTAVKNSHLQMVEMLLRNHADANDQLDEAAGAGKNDIVNAFLRAGANPDNGVRAAAQNSKVSTLQLLLSNNADANLAMPIAIEKNNTSMVQLCLTASKPADVFRSDYVVTACKNSNLDILRALLLAGAPPDPGMIVSIGKGDVALVDALIKANAAVNRPDYMSTAAQVNSAGVVKLLLDAGADPAPGFPISAEKGNMEIVDMMLAKGVNPDLGLLPAVKGNAINVAEKLISRGADARKPEVILASVPHNNAALTRMLIDNGADPASVLQQTINTDKYNVLGVLIEKGVDVKDPVYLNKAVRANYVSTAAVLIEKGGSNPNAVDGSGNTYMHIAARLGYPNMIRMLGHDKADANKVDAEDNTPLLVAMKTREQKIGRGTFLNVINALLEAGGDPNTPDKDGATPLHLLCKGSMKNHLREACVVALLGKGANACAKDGNNKTPREYLPGMEGGPRRKLKAAMKKGDCK